MSEFVWEFPPEYTDDPSLDQYRFVAPDVLHQTCEAEVDRILGADPKNLTINSSDIQHVPVVRPITSPSGYESLEPSGSVAKAQTEAGVLFHVIAPIAADKGKLIANYVWRQGDSVGGLTLEGLGPVKAAPHIVLATARLITPRLVTSVGFNPRRQRIAEGAGRDEIAQMGWLERFRARKNPIK